MVARPATELPTDAGWAFEPKADGFLNSTLGSDVLLRGRLGMASA
jgi:hypothetical protein